jgi:hypothetical protein
MHHLPVVRAHVAGCSLRARLAVDVNVGRGRAESRGVELHEGLLIDDLVHPGAVLHKTRFLFLNFPLVLCLSRACLGKLIVLSIKMAQKRGLFRTVSWLFMM